MSYKRIREIDEFYEDPLTRRRVRLTKNAETKEVGVI